MIRQDGGSLAGPQLSDAAADTPPAPRHFKQYGSGFASGFQAFRDSGQFCDVVVTLPDGSEHPLHLLLLASRSDFFLTAFASDFAEARQRRLSLHLDRGAAGWPALLDFFYTDRLQLDDDNVLPLMALSRQLLISSVDGFCRDYVTGRLAVSNCMAYLRSAVAMQLDDLQADCVAIAAQGFPYVFNADVAGLPATSIVAILQHPDLVVHCEQQVLEFVQRYLASTHADEAAVHSVCSQVRFAYLDNASLTAVGRQGLVPQAVLHEGLKARMEFMDRPGLDLCAVVPPPRLSYCCNSVYSLPGGCTHMDLDLNSVWDSLVLCMTARASGCLEGQTRNLLSSDQDAWFETNDSFDSPPWVEVLLPHNVTITSLARFTYSHGHKRAGYYRMRNFKTQVCEKLGGSYVDVPTRITDSSSCEVQALPPTSHPGLSTGAASARCFQSLRVVATGPQEDNVHRLCIRNLRMYGRIRVDLMAQQGGFSLPAALIQDHLNNPFLGPLAGGSSSSCCGSARSSCAGAGGSGSVMGVADVVVILPNAYPAAVVRYGGA